MYIYCIYIYIFTFVYVFFVCLFIHCIYILKVTQKHTRFTYTVKGVLLKKWVPVGSLGEAISVNRKLKLMQGTLARNPSDSHKKSTKTNRAMETITIFNRRYIFIHGWCSILMLVFRAFRGVWDLGCWSLRVPVSCGKQCCSQKDCRNGVPIALSQTLEWLRAIGG